MINFKKGPALSLHQVNYVGAPDSGNSTAITSGMVVRVTADGTIAIGSTGTLADDKNALFGFAINNETAGDVIESGVIGVYALDGASVIETDHTAATITTGHYPIGHALGVNTDGAVVSVDPATYAGKIIGWVEGIRSLPGKQNTTVSLTNNVTGLPTGRSFTYQDNITVLGVKLAS